MVCASDTHIMRPCDSSGVFVFKKITRLNMFTYKQQRENHGK